jgi:hypothetical protein
MRLNLSSIRKTLGKDADIVYHDFKLGKVNHLVDLLKYYHPDVMNLNNEIRFNNGELRKIPGNRRREGRRFRPG